MAVDELSLRIKEKKCVVERSMARRILHSLINAYNNANLQLGGCFCHGLGLRPGHYNAVRAQVRINFLHSAAVP
jgi:hypothetical protein